MRGGGRGPLALQDAAQGRDQLPQDKLRWRYAINIEGQLAVTQALLPMIRKARSRIIMIGPVGDRFTTEPSGQWA